VSRTTVICLFSVAISVGAVACSSSENPPDSGSGGHGSGGSESSGSAGRGGSAGTTGSAGAPLGAGGATGAAGVAGSAERGGTSGSAGATGSGGRGGASGSTAGSGAGATGTAGRGGAGGSTAGSAGTSGSSGTGGAATGGEGGRAGSGGAGGRGGGGAAGGNNRGGAGGQNGGTAGTTSTGGSGGGGFNPCKASPCVILPLGDSITHGFSSTDDAGYRSPLFKLIVAANQNVTFIGSLTNGPTTVSGKTFPRNHEGHDGFTVTQITGLVPPAKSFSTTPHIVLLHAGTNDMTMNADPTTTANQLSTLITNLVNAAPDALIVVAKIVPLGYSNTNYNSYIAKIPGVVQAHSSNHVVMVDMSTLPTSDIRGNGNVHPTDQGYADMANLWYGAIKSYLPQ
jgi:lysophospholipase L1-like esterase